MRGLVVISLIGAVGGAVVGIVGGAFRWCLGHADSWRISAVDHARSLPGPGWLVPIVAVAACAFLARLIVRAVPEAAGSGIQDVEAAWREEAGPPEGVVLPAKFVGGLLAIGSGLALGREGPTVHMGAVVGTEAGHRLRLADSDVRILQAAFGGAGLAVAFNAPLGGALFVFEEVSRSFRTRLVLVTLIGCATAIACSRIILADQPDFAVAPIATPSGWHLVIFVLFGLATGLLGAIYNRLIMASLAFTDRVRRISPEIKAALVGALVGLLLFIDPYMVGDGHLLTQRSFGGRLAVLTLVGYAVVRFVIGPICYATGTPGGLFAPLLAVGAVWGILFHELVHLAVPGFALNPDVLAIVGMSAFFGAVVRSPFTGIVLIVEMTATTTLLVPLLAASFAAVLVATLMRSAPIYDSLWERVLVEPGAIRSGPKEDPPPPS